MAIKGFRPLLASRNSWVSIMALKTGQTASAAAVYLREWRRRRRVSRRQFCAHCENIFTPKRIDAAFCSVRCRQIAHRRRKAAGVSTWGNLPQDKTAPTRPAQPPWRVSMSFRPPSPQTGPEAVPERSLRPAEGPKTVLGPRGERIDIASLIA
jgi:hypothetical protein